MNIVNSIQLENTKDKLGFIGIFIYFALPSMIGILTFVGINKELIDKYNIGALIRLVITIILVLHYIYANKKNNIFRVKFNIQIVLWILIYGSALTFSFLLNNQNKPYLIEIILYFVISILPIILIMWYINDPKKIILYMRFPAYYILIRTCIIPFTNYYMEHINYMTLTYDSMISWAVITYFAFKNRRIFDIIISIATSGIYFIYGARGGVLIVTAFYVFCLLFFMNKKKRRMFMLFIISTLLLLTFIIPYLNDLLLEQDIHSRVLSSITNGSFFKSDARINFYYKLIVKIVDNPFGYGIGYDRVIGGSRAWYAHNVFLELFINYGLIFGALLSLFLIYIFIYMGFYCKNKDYTALFSVFAIPGIIMLQISKSIYTEIHIFCALLIFLMYKNNVENSPILFQQTRRLINKIKKKYFKQSYKINIRRIK